MRKLLALTLAPFVAVACDGISGPDAATTDAHFDVTAEAAASHTVQVKLRCARAVTGSVTVYVQAPGGDYPFYMSCPGNTIDSSTFGFNPGDVDIFYQADKSWSFGSCGSSKPSLLYNDIPGRQKCFVGRDGKGKSYYTVTVGYIKDPA